MGSSLTPNIYDFLIKIDPFDKLPDEIVSYLSGQVKVRYLSQGERIEFSALCEDRYLYIIRTGAIEQKRADGQLRARLGEDDQFGFTFLEPLKDTEDGYYAEAISDSLLYLVPHEVVKEICVKHPEFVDYFAARAQVRLTSAISSINRDANREDEGFFYRRVGEIASENIAIVESDTPIRQVAQIMCGEKKNRSSCAVVKQNDEIVGIVTDRDMTRGVAAGIDTGEPIHLVMTHNPQLIQADDKVVQAISVMLQHNIRCMPVLRGKEVVGLLTTSHLVHNHRTQALFLIEKIKYASSVNSLAALKNERESIFESLVESGIGAVLQGQVMAMIMDAFTRRLIEISEELLGPPPCDYVWMVAGSHARNEVHMLSDQDSAIVLSDDVKPEDIVYFRHLAMRVCNGLFACGYPLCDGKYMAATPKWCQPLDTWKAYYSKWVASPEYNKLLSISVFLEVRSVYGNQGFVHELQQHLHHCIQSSSNFLPSLVRDAIDTQPPLGIFNNLVLEKGGDNSNTLNIKKYALNLIIDLARIFSLSAGGSMTGTEERFQYAAAHGALSEDSCENIIGAFRFIRKVRFKHQMQSLRDGRNPDNHISPDSFSSFERKHLKEAFKIISELQDVAKLRFIKG
ncbi:putative nucleotidyltransferase substrate binding domain-containing protein [Vibrio quintilis]|uniref:Inosine 5'-monophosphate dehydrogenase n=1 Tax=Vibrio quintilis TaxID=1117707 RepID=A0A1M7Z051_9VIBR|nr:putative nucleotidyltransferase substrate binding domain-containing protein [Vibrio quintilis]SHO58185.1 inosine 5'-monophosphate dehydrogenase [Vibrio quintilis]